MPLAKQFVDDAIVEIEALRIGLAGAVGENARPRDRQAKAFAAEALQRLNVFLVEMIEIVGDVAGVAVVRFAGSVRERVPDRRLASVFVDRAFDLIGGGGAAPEKSGGEFEFGRLATCASANLGREAVANAVAAVAAAVWAKRRRVSLVMDEYCKWKRRRFAARRRLAGAKLLHGGGRERFADHGSKFGAENLDGAHHFWMRQRRDAHLKCEARNSAERFVDVENFFGDGLCVADEQRAGWAARCVELCARGA